MRIPHWGMIGLLAAIVLTVVWAGAMLWRQRPGADLAGSWNGYGWGLVDLQRTGGGGYSGTYSSTYGHAVGRIDVVWSPRARRYEGTWSEGTFRHGQVTVWADDNGSVSGFYSADLNCVHEPGNPVRQEFTWSKGLPAPAISPRSVVIDIAR